MSSPLVRRRGRAARLADRGRSRGRHGDHRRARLVRRRPRPPPTAPRPIPVADLAAGRPRQRPHRLPGRRRPTRSPARSSVSSRTASPPASTWSSSTSTRRPSTAAGGIWQGMSGLAGLRRRRRPHRRRRLRPVLRPVADRRRDAVRGDGRLPGRGPRPARSRSARAWPSRSRPHSDVSAGQAEQGFAPARRCRPVSPGSRRPGWPSSRPPCAPTSRRTRTSPGGPRPTPATADDVVAGGNLAASFSYGDITRRGVGTATSVCDGQVVGFGHPMDFRGETTMSLHPAERDLRPAGLARRAVQGGEPRRRRPASSTRTTSPGSPACSAARPTARRSART